MIKHICDECGANVSVEEFLGVLVIREFRDVFGPANDGGLRTKKQERQRQFEFCKNCIGKVFPKTIAED